MIPLASKDNVDPADSDNPYGIPRDRVGSIAGTLGNKKNFMDVLTLMDKIMDGANTVDPGNHHPNGFPDNDYSGWQLYDALIAIMKQTHDYDRFYVKLSQAGGTAPTVDFQAANDLGISGTLSRVGAGDYRITFTAGTFPDGNKLMMWNSPCPLVGGDIYVNLTGTNILRIRTYDTSGVAADDILSLTDFYFHRYA